MPTTPIRGNRNFVIDTEQWEKLRRLVPASAMLRSTSIPLENVFGQRSIYTLVCCQRLIDRGTILDVARRSGIFGPVAARIPSWPVLVTDEGSPAETERTGLGTDPDLSGPDTLG